MAAKKTAAKSLPLPADLYRKAVADEMEDGVDRKTAERLVAANVRVYGPRCYNHLKGAR